jgi:hypothetical protein
MYTNGASTAEKMGMKMEGTTADLGYGSREGTGVVGTDSDACGMLG